MTALDTNLLIRGGLAIAVAVLMWAVFFNKKDMFGDQYYEAANANWDEDYTNWNNAEDDDDYEAEYEESEDEDSGDEYYSEADDDDYEAEQGADDDDYEDELGADDLDLAPNADQDYENDEAMLDTAIDDGLDAGEDYENDEVQDIAQEYPFEPQEAPDPYALLL